MNYVVLSEVAKIIMGQSPPSSTYNVDGNGLPFFQGKADFGEIYPRPRVYCSEPIRIAEPGDVLITVRAPVGPTNLNPERSCIGRGLSAIRVGTNIERNYLFYFLRYYEPELAKAGTGSTFAAISREGLETIKLPLPPLPEQQRIAAILQKADRLRRLRRYARQLSDGYLQSVFLEMFGDPVTNPKGWKTLKASQIFDIQLGKMRSEKEITGKYLKPYLRNVNVQWGYLDLSDIKEMDFTPNEMEKYRLQQGDILVCEGGEVGRTAIYNGELDECGYQNALHRLRAKNHEINSDYFIHYMKVACAFGVVSKLTSQVTIAHFTAEKFAELEVMLAPLKMQNEFSEICQKTYRLQKRQKEAERQAEQLFQSLLHQAFELR